MRAVPFSGGRHRGLQVLALLGVLLAPAAPAAGGPQDPVRDPAGAGGNASALGALVGILAPPAGGEAPDPDAAIQAIHDLGRPAIAVLVCVLAGEVELPLVAPGTEDVPVHPQALAQRGAVLSGALASFPSEAVLAHLSERLRAEPDMSQLLMLASLLGSIADPGACQLLVEAIESADPLLLRTRYVQQALEGALLDHLRRDRSALDLVWRSALDCPAERLCVFARALGTLRTARGAELLASWIDRRPEANGELLKQLGGMAGLAVSSEVLAAVRSQLQAVDPDVRRCALVAAGLLHDQAAFDDLVGQLAKEPALVAASARWGLRTLCGADLGADPQAWLDWREREATWLAERAPILVEELSSELPGVVLGAVGELLQHPFHRHALAEALGPLVGHADRAVARGACAALARLDSDRSLPWLLAALESADPELCGHAADALRQLTGLDLPPERRAWSLALAAE